MINVVPGRPKDEPSGAQLRTENLEIPGSRFACPGMTIKN